MKSTIVLHCGDSRDILKTLDPLSIDVVITDPPYPDNLVEEYGYHDGILDPLKLLPCRQLIFWSAKVEFPLDYSAIHIWDKKTGVGSMYERIFERNGGKAYRVFRYYLINSIVAQSYTGEDYTGHPSQKPVKLMAELISRYSAPGDFILDPFMGTGSIAVACAQLGRSYIGIELSERYVEIAKKRIERIRK